MRSLKYLAALLPLHFLSAVASGPEKDVIVVVTSLRTITVCPITELWTCPPDFPDFPTSVPDDDSTVSPTWSAPETTTTSDGSEGGDDGHSTKPTHPHHPTTRITWSDGHATTTPTPETTTPAPDTTTPAPETTTTTEGDEGSETTTPKSSDHPWTRSSSWYFGNGTTPIIPPSPTTTPLTTETTSTVDDTTTSSESTPKPDETTTKSTSKTDEATTKTTSNTEETTTKTTSKPGETTTKTTSKPGETTTKTTSKPDETTTKTTSKPGETTTKTTSNTDEVTTSSKTTATVSGSTTSSKTTATVSGSTTSSQTTATVSGSTTSSKSASTSSESTTKTSTTTSASTTTRVSTTTSCVPSTVTSAVGIATPTCNSASDRSDWCGPRSLDDDTHTIFSTGETVSYTLLITAEDDLNYDGTPKFGFAINGKTVGDAIVANWGDTVEVTVVNGLTNNATTIHWHGIRQFGTNDQDGVPGVTECAIPPGTARTYRWQATTYGTGWYHSHAIAQYGAGIRGPVIIHGPATANYDYDMGTVMIDETFSQTIFQMGYNAARTQGQLAPSQNYLLNGKNKNAAGGGENTKWTVRGGKKHLFRIINSAAQSAYAVHFDNHKIKVISADYTPITPYDTDILWIQPGQRYNVIVEMNQTPGAYYLRAVTQTGCGVSCGNDGLGTANGIFTYEGTCGEPVSEGFSIVTAGDCKDEPLANLKPYIAKDAGSPTKFNETVKLLPGGNAGAQVFDGFGRIIRWYLGGLTDLTATSGSLTATNGINVNWTEPTLKSLATLSDAALNTSVYSNAAVLNGPADDWVYFVIQNNFQTSHPMHLHGHDFSVLGQGRGTFSPSMVDSLSFNNPIRRDTVLLFGIGRPGAFTSGWTVIGFKTDNPGAWLMHCHLIWHADGGMGLQFIEQPSDIHPENYYDAGFKSECSAYKSYDTSGGARDPYEAGIRRRHAQAHNGYAHRSHRA